MLMDAHLSLPPSLSLIHTHTHTHTHTLTWTHTVTYMSAMGPYVYIQAEETALTKTFANWFDDSYTLSLVCVHVHVRCMCMYMARITLYMYFRLEGRRPPQNNINVFSGHRAKSRECQSVQCAFEWRFSWPHIRSIELSSGITFSWGIPLVWQQRQYTAFLQVLFYTM